MPDVLILGAGVSGLSAAIDLAQAGLQVTILEARNRLGGRIFTDHSTKYPIDLGAEFIHGLAPEIWQPLQKNHLSTTEYDGDNWCFRNGKLTPCDFFSEVDKILGKMKDTPRDQSFFHFLKNNFPNPTRDPKLEEAKFWTLRYVSGFNAADPAHVSVNWLVQEKKTEEQIDGERAFFPNQGYSALIKTFYQRLQDINVPIHLNHVVETIRWKKGAVEVNGRAKNKHFTLTAPRALITVPLGVLLARSKEKGALSFIPKLPLPKQKALAKLEMGHVVRVTLEFKERFWRQVHPAGSRKTLSNLSFLFSDDVYFPTWWTKSPSKMPIITGWAPFKSADSLSGRSRKFVVNKALTALSAALQTPKQRVAPLLKSAHFHNWQTDPFSRGAYSYVKVGGKHAPEILAQSLARTLFFAGEATDPNAQTGTVHGAIASGKRAAKEILKSSIQAVAR